MTDIIGKGFSVGDPIDDSTPIVSIRHPVSIGGYEVTGRWLELLDGIRSPFVSYDEDGSWFFKSLSHEHEYKEIRKRFDKVFLEQFDNLPT